MEITLEITQKTKRNRIAQKREDVEELCINHPNQNLNHVG